ncbi:MAG: hypothetical protein ACREX9_04725 [Gammaproteobacteria bacterium]
MRLGRAQRPSTDVKTGTLLAVGSIAARGKTFESGTAPSADMDSAAKYWAQKLRYRLCILYKEGDRIE